MPHFPLYIPLVMNMTFLGATSFIFEARPCDLFLFFFCLDTHLHSKQRKYSWFKCEVEKKMHAVMHFSLWYILFFFKP